ncbi:MAG: HAD hydrolase-like protein [Microthrixaceae bacterium]
MIAETPVPSFPEPPTDLELVGVDADDTLWETEGGFQEIQARFEQLMGPHLATDSVAAAHLEDVERRNLAVFGYGVKGFTLSMIETAIMLSDGAVTGDDIAHILDWSRELLGHTLEPYPGVVEALDLLATSNIRRSILTKGDLFEQESKVAASGLADRFDGVEILPEKDEAHYDAVLRRWGVDPERFLMVGNSVRSDILPVLQLGGWAVWVPSVNQWAHEVAEPPTEHPRFAMARSLWEAVSLLPRERQPGRPASATGLAPARSTARQGRPG